MIFILLNSLFRRFYAVGSSPLDRLSFLWNLIGFSSLLDGPSTLWTFDKVSVLLGWTVHLVDLIIHHSRIVRPLNGLKFSYSLDDLPIFMDYSFHPPLINSPLYGLGRIYILHGWICPLYGLCFSSCVDDPYGLCFSSSLDDPSTLWTLFLIILGWSVYIMDLIRIFILFGWFVHFVDFSLYPSAFWTL